jgi:hypothetical protein
VRYGTAPDAFVIDLDPGLESGYEILRLRHSRLQWQSIKVIVWTMLGEHATNASFAGF